MKLKATSGIMLTLLLASMLGMAFNVAPATATVNATIDIDPNTLNLKSEGEWITCYIELPEGYNVADINRSTILLNNTYPVDPFWVNTTLESVIGDYDHDGIPDLMVKFDRDILTGHFRCVLKIKYGDVLLLITGELFDGTPFEGSDTIRLIFAGDTNRDTFVNIIDLATIGAAWGTRNQDGNYNADTDFNNDGFVNIIDLAIFATNWGARDPYSSMTT